MAERKQAPVSDPVEPRTRRGRRAMDKVAAEAALGKVRAENKATEAKTSARTKTATLAEQEKQQAIIDRQKAAAVKKRKERNAQRWVDTKTRLAAVARTSMTVGPIVAPMSIAWTGQIGFAGKVLNWPFAGGVGYAAAYELTIIFTAWMYHEARKDGDSGAGYRLLTWLFAIGNGVQQWWHWSDNWHATPRSVTYSVMTAIGIIVWEAYARLVHRRKLRAEGKLSGSRPAIGWLRWLRYPRISFTAWSGTIRHGFDNFTDMWTWAEIERERGRTRRDKVKTMRQQVKDLEKQLADLKPSKSDPIVVMKAEQVPTPDLDPIEPEVPALEAGPTPDLDGPKELEVGSPERKVGPNGEVFDGPSAAEIQAVQEMVEGEIRLNRENVAKYIRENSDRLNQPGISTWRAARVAEWGKGPNALKVVS